MKMFLACLLVLFSCNAYAQTALPTIDKSGTIVTGGTFQTITLPAGTRHSFDFQNMTASDTCYIYTGGGTATVNNSIKIGAGNGYLRSAGAIPNDSLQVTCTTTADAFRLYLQ